MVSGLRQVRRPCARSWPAETWIAIQDLVRRFLKLSEGAKQIPMVAALHIAVALTALTAVFLARAGRGATAAHRVLAAAFALLAVQLMLNAVDAGQSSLRFAEVRPVIAAALPGLTFWHIRLLFAPRRSFRWLPALNAVLPAAAMAIAVVGFGRGAWIDLSLAGLGFAYAVAVAVQSGLNVSPSQRRWRWCVAVWLTATALIDMAVLIELGGAPAFEQSSALTLGVVAIIGAVGYVVLAGLSQSGPLAWLGARRLVGEVEAQDTARRAAALVEREKAWRGANLTVSRLARRLSVPQKRLSGAINQVFAVSYSEWISAYRVADAQALMRADPERSLAAVMLEAGFQSKSHFNATFKRRTGLTPSAWRVQNATSDRDMENPA